MPPVFNLEPNDYMPLIQRAVAEDLGAGDVTSKLALDRGRGTFHLVGRESGILCGQRIAEAVLGQYDDTITVAWTAGVEDGRPLITDRPLAVIEGPGPAILAAERVLLNFLQRLSGVASLTGRHVAAVAHTSAKIYDTRKTTPGWRALEKYAVRCGGGHNHRMGLYDAVLIKDNHLAGIEPDRLAAHVFAILDRASRLDPPPDFVEVEVDGLDQLESLFKVVGIDVILLDNFTPDELRRAVHMRDEHGLRDRIELEASGGVNLESVKRVAETGVDRIAVGALTHSAPAVDIGLEAG